MQRTKLVGELRAMGGALPPGSPLPNQRELCASFGVSTFTLHKALRQLEQEGLLTVIPRRGIFTCEPRPRRRHVVHLVYLDKPGVVRVPEYGLSGFLSVVGQQGMECRVTHIDARDMGQFGQIMREVRDNADAIGVVVTGYVDEKIGAFLHRFDQPWTMFGDAHCEKPLNDLPIVCPDNFQSAALGTEVLMRHGCDHIVLVNFRSRIEWSWLRENRAGVFASLELHPEIKVFLPEAKTISDPRVYEVETAAWLKTRSVKRLGILCRCFYALHVATPLRHLVDKPEDVAITVLDEDLPPDSASDISKVICPTWKRAEAALRRLEAMRRGMDSPGRMRLPAELVEDSVPPAATAPRGAMILDAAPLRAAFSDADAKAPHHV